MSRRSYLIVGTGMLSAISLILELYVHFPILPTAPFLLYSPGDLPIIMASMIFGPISGVLSAFVNSTLFAMITGQGGPWGAFMHFVASGGMAAVIGLIQRQGKRLHLAFGLGIITRILLMIPLNLLITPLFMGVPRQVVARMILPVIVPFNLIHGGLNSLLAYPLIRTIPKEMVLKMKEQSLCESKSLLD